MNYGTDLFAGYVTAMFDLARDFAAILRESGDFEPAVEPESNIVCFRYLKRGEGDLDGLQRRIRRTLLESGRFYIVQTDLRGHVWLRSTLINPRTTLADLEALLEEIRAITLSGARKGARPAIKRFSSRPSSSPRSDAPKPRQAPGALVRLLKLPIGRESEFRDMNQFSGIGVVSLEFRVSLQVAVIA